MTTIGSIQGFVFVTGKKSDALPMVFEYSSLSSAVQALDIFRSTCNREEVNLEVMAATSLDSLMQSHPSRFVA